MKCSGGAWCCVGKGCSGGARCCGGMGCSGELWCCSGIRCSGGSCGTVGHGVQWCGYGAEEPGAVVVYGASMVWVRWWCMMLRWYAVQCMVVCGTCMKCSGGAWCCVVRVAVVVQGAVVVWGAVVSYGAAVVLGAVVVSCGTVGHGVQWCGYGAEEPEVVCGAVVVHGAAVV